MKIPPRILVPVVGALSVTAALLGFLWWQLNLSAAKLEQASMNAANNTTATALATVQIPAVDDSVDRGDEALLHLRQGDLLALQGDWAGAQTEFEKGVTAGGGLPALRKLAEAQLQRRDIAGVQSTIEKLKAAGARSEDLVLLQSLVLLRTGDVVKAGNLLTNAPESPHKHYGLALYHLIQGHHTQVQDELKIVQAGWDPTLRAYAHAIQSAYDEFALFPESQEIHLQTLLAKALAEVRECDLALPLLHGVTEKQDDYRDAWVLQGFCELTTERYPQALSSLEHAYGLDPEKPETQYFLGRTYRALGDHKNALTFLQYALQNGLQPQDDVRRLIAAEALESGNSKLAVEQYRALSDVPDAKFDTNAKLVTALISIGEHQEAYDRAKKVTTRWADNAQSWDLLGAAAASLEKKDEAKTAYQKALQINPADAAAKEGLKKL